LNRRYFVSFACAALLVGAAAAAFAQVTPERLQQIGLRTPTAPSFPAEFQLPRLDGGTVTLGSLKGKVVLLSFWATWCGPCRVEMPSMQRVYDQLKDQGLEILAVNMMDDTTQAKAFVRELKLTFPIVADAGETVAARFAVRALPTTYLLDRRGRVIARAVGGREWDRPETISILRDLLQESPSGPE